MPPSAAAQPLGPRHVAALEQLRGRPVTVSELASRLGPTLPTVSGVLADLDRAGFVERHPDPADRRRTIVQIPPAQATQIGERLDGPAKSLARVLDKLTPSEQEAFLKAMDCSKPSSTARTTSAESVTRDLAGFRHMTTKSGGPSRRARSSRRNIEPGSRAGVHRRERRIAAVHHERPDLRPGARCDQRHITIARVRHDHPVG